MPRLAGMGDGRCGMEDGRWEMGDGRDKLLIFTDVALLSHIQPVPCSWGKEKLGGESIARSLSVEVDGVPRLPIRSDPPVLTHLPI